MVSLALLTGLGTAHAQPAHANTTPAGSAPKDITTRTGVLVVAMGDDATEAARALARAVYGKARLQPEIDNEAAEVLAGRAPPEGASAQLRELAAVRDSLGLDPEAPAARRLLTALGQEHGVEVVVVVAKQQARFVARVLRVAAGSFDPVQILAKPHPPAPPSAPQPPDVSEPPDAEPPDTEPDVEPPDAESATPVAAPIVPIEWPGAADSLLALMPQRAIPAKAPPPLAPAKTRSDVDLQATADDDDSRQWYENPWFWGSAGAVAAVGVTVLVLAVSTEDDVGTVNLGGKVAP